MATQTRTSVGEATVERGAGFLIVTPTYNEIANLPRFIERTLDVAPRAHILVVDDGSPDGTGALADELAAKDERIRVIHRPKKLGLGTAYIEGFLLGLKGDYQYFFEMDADLSHDPRYLPAFYTELLNGADVAVGSRNVPGGGVEGWGIGRHLLSKGGSLYSRVILGVAVRDLTTGFKAFTRRALEAIDLTTLESNGYSFQIEGTYRALLAGLEVREVPITFVDRRAGSSKMNRRIILEALLRVWKLRLESVAKRRHP